MKFYQVSYVSGVGQALVIEGADVASVVAYFNAIEPDAEICSVIEIADITPFKMRGMPILKADAN